MSISSENDPGFLVEDMQKSFDANVYGVLNTVYAFLPLIRKGTIKKVIAISSGMGDIGMHRLFAVPTLEANKSVMR